MPKSSPDIEQDVLSILRFGPAKQSEIGDRFPLNRYLDVGYTVRDLAMRGLISREKAGSTYILRLVE